MWNLTNKNTFLPWVLSLFFCFLATESNAQTDYSNFSELTNNLKKLQKNNSGVCKLESLTKTVGGYDIWALTLSKGNAEDKPAIAIVSGVNGKHILGPEMAFKIAENILTNHPEILEKTTFYIFPNMSPNATENYFSTVKSYPSGNAKSTDDDRDGEKDEDAFDDLNKDGLITLMRIEDVTGNYIKFKDDDRIMVKANIDDGEIGVYKILSEGIDSDQDGQFNEDGKGGVIFNKNFSYKFPNFQPGAGDHPVSEKENRALLDFLYQKWNIYSIITLGPTNNLSTPLKHNASNAKKRVVTSILKDDAELNKFISEKYNKIIKAKNAPATKEQKGGFFEWSYFHFGKLAFSTPGWWVPKFEGDSINKASKNKKVNFLKWAEQEKLSNYFVDWTEIDHPDFPNKKVEIGGIAPYRMINPPYKMVNSISIKHTNFILEVAKIQPKIELHNVDVEAVNGLTRITVDVYNKGLIPTHTEMGKRSRWLRKIKVELSLNKNQEIISGKKITLVNSIDGDSSQQFTWLIKGKGSVQLEAGTSHTGTDTATIKLK